MTLQDSDKEDESFIDNIVSVALLKYPPFGVDIQQWETACKKCIRNFWNKQRAKFSVVCC